MKVVSIELSNFTISVQNVVRFIPSTAIETQSQDGFQKEDGGMWWTDWEQDLGRCGVSS